MSVITDGAPGFAGGDVPGDGVVQDIASSPASRKEPHRQADLIRKDTNPLPGYASFADLEAAFEDLGATVNAPCPPGHPPDPWRDARGGTGPPVPTAPT